MILPLMNAQHLNQVLYIFKTKHRSVSSKDEKGVGEGKARPSQRKRTDLVGLRIRKEDTLLPPGKALGQKGKGLVMQGVKGMRDGKALLAIRVIRCS